MARRGQRRSVAWALRLCLGAAALSMALLALLALRPVLAGDAAASPWLFAVVAAVVAGAASLWIGFALVDDHAASLGRLAGDIDVAAATGAPTSRFRRRRDLSEPAGGGEVAALTMAADRMLAQQGPRPGEGDGPEAAAGPPSPRPYDGATPLTELPVVSLDLETTGLDPSRDRIVSIGAVRADGGRLWPRAALDLLVDPGIPIPERSARVHGITDALVAGAPDLAALWPQLIAFIDGTVVVGHQVGFDLAVLAAEAGRRGLPWAPPPALDTMRLYARIATDDRLDLDSAAAALGVPVIGRHTALGDALVAGGLYLRTVGLLAEAGILTWGAAAAVGTPPPWGSGPERGRG